MRPIWKGTISFGLVTVPVGLRSALAPGRNLSFRQLHRKDASPIDYRRFCEKEDVEVPWSDIVKGYELTKGKYVVVDEKDFARAKVEATHTFAIQDFVPAGAIEHFYFDHPYYLSPSGKGTTKAYALLREALGRSQRIGVGTIVIREREHLAALEPVGDALMLTTLRFAHEIRTPASLDLPASSRGVNKRETELALRLVDSLAAAWRPEKYKDSYRQALLQVIKRKAEGKAVALPGPARPPKVIDLMEALRASLASGAKAGAARKRRAQRRAA
jgi:DNA end-binding protein Ku